jgi:hypothetical protein
VAVVVEFILFQRVDDVEEFFLGADLLDVAADLLILFGGLFDFFDSVFVRLLFFFNLPGEFFDLSCLVEVLPGVMQSSQEKDSLFLF